jgi:hypothetical protein
MRPVSRRAMAIALALSAGSMLAHNLYELPIGPLAAENTGPIAVAAAIGIAYAIWPGSRVVAGVAFGWGLLNLVIGGIVTVLPLSILPFVPEQSLSHYAAHVVYAVGQVPLVVLAYRALARPFVATGHPATGR